ncbi:MAG: hypothetical protein WCG04_03140 [Alphaproteobacteria bacterium]
MRKSMYILSASAFLCLGTAPVNADVGYLGEVIAGIKDRSTRDVSASLAGQAAEIVSNEFYNLVHGTGMHVITEGGKKLQVLTNNTNIARNIIKKALELDEGYAKLALGAITATAVVALPIAGVPILLTDVAAITAATSLLADSFVMTKLENYIIDNYLAPAAKAN